MKYYFPLNQIIICSYQVRIKTIFITRARQHIDVRVWIIALCLCAFCFIVPLQCYAIGNDLGLGIQGAVFRYQVTVEGNSIITLAEDLSFIVKGIYSGKTAISIILWTLGTVVLVLTTIFSLIYWNRLPRHYLKFIAMGLVGAGILYLGSCVAQYGLLFSGPAGISLPLGVLLLFLYALLLLFYTDWFFIVPAKTSIG